MTIITQDLLIIYYVLYVIFILIKDVKKGMFANNTTTVPLLHYQSVTTLIVALSTARQPYINISP